MVSAKAIDALLPQTQCGECSYSGCLPYAQAIAEGSITINRCPPGGVSTVKALGQLLNIDPAPFLAEALSKTRAPSIAMIREEECIGCTKCIQACPVDAIIGSAKLMHTIITDECTGCGLCLEPCPVDCIELVSLPEARYNKEKARERNAARLIRDLREEHEKQQSYREKRKLAIAATQVQDKKAKQDYILQALARAKTKTNE